MSTCPKCGYRNIVKGRSNPQNAYYWGVIIPMFAEYTGYSHDETHEMLKSKLLPKVSNLGGQEVKTQRSTASLTTIEFEDFTLRARALGAENNLNIPEPNEED